MRKIILCVFLAWGWILAGVRIPLADAPGFFGEFSKNPARRYSGLNVGLVWTEPMEGVEYEVAGLSAEWGNGKYRIGTAFTSAFLDSLYRSETLKLGGSLALSGWTFGVAGDLDIQYVPGAGSWWRTSGRTGLRTRLIWNFSAGAWGEFPSDFEANTVGVDLDWSPTEMFKGLAEWRYRPDVGWNIVLGEKFLLGCIFVQAYVSYPGPGIGVGIFWRGSHLGSGIGVSRLGDYLDARAASLSIGFR